MLMSDGAHLLVFANRRLHQVHRTCIERGCEQQLAIFATTPLTSEEWSPMDDGRLRVFTEGHEVTGTTSAGPA